MHFICAGYKVVEWNKMTGNLNDMLILLLTSCRVNITSCFQTGDETVPSGNRKAINCFE